MNIAPLATSVTFTTRGNYAREIVRRRELLARSTTLENRPETDDRTESFVSFVRSSISRLVF